MPRKPRVNFDFGDVSYRGKTVVLTKTQYQLLIHLVAAGRAGMRTPRLHRIVFGIEYDPTGNDPRVKVHIAQMRQRLRKAGIAIKVQGRNGFGYRAVLE